MPDLQKRIDSFCQLGKRMENFLQPDDYYLCEQSNPWFTKENVDYALKSISALLERKNLEKWLSKYPLAKKNANPLKIGVVTAGNLPLVGFHDFLCVLISGNAFHAKLSSKDDFLFKKIINALIEINPLWTDYIDLSENMLKDKDAYIATGSNNSAGYFEYYFRNVPSIIRRNRNSVAVLTGNETESELMGLADDMFLFFGLGCRSVSKIYLPNGYNFEPLINAISKYSYIQNHYKYCNNYDYYKSIFLVNRLEFLDTEFCLLKESVELASPVSVVYYEYYQQITNLVGNLNNLSDKLQCVVGKEVEGLKTIKPGKAQQPEIDDYADGIDTLAFLTELKS
ncbi:MAG: hypothetical protein JXR58_06565 [Bacteroidales bacterium]|nr:hypothetical protein [Bacteroidales bacterium]